MPSLGSVLFECKMHRRVNTYLEVSRWLVLCQLGLPKAGLSRWSPGSPFWNFSSSHSSLLPTSVHFSHSVISNSLWPHGLQHTRLPCPSPTPGVYPNSCPLSRWWHPTISSSVVPFSSCLQSFLASRSFQMSQFFTSGPLNHLEGRGKLGKCPQIPPLCPAEKTAHLTVHRNDCKWNSCPTHILL